MKKMTKLLSIILAVMVLFVSFPIQTEAATVKLNKTKATLYIGKTTTLKVKGTSEKVTWTSSNKKVVTVSSKGKVTGKKAGTATISAKVGKKTYKCKVTVKKPYISETKKTIYRKVNKSFTLKLKGTEIKLAKSSNTKVATVNKKGRVTAKKAGKATITLTGKNGKTYKCKITVSDCPVEIHKIVDEGNRIYFWTSLHGGLYRTEYQDQKQAVMEEALSLAATKWGGFKRTQCTQHVWWGTRELCLIEIFSPN